MTTRERLHQLIDGLPDNRIHALCVFLEEWEDEDDEPLTPEDIAAIEEGEKAVAEGRVCTTEELCRELGLTLP